MIYRIMQRLFPSGVQARDPKRIVIVRPCCIGDVVMATAALSALREAFPAAHIAWAAGAWSAPAIAHHPDLDAILDTGADMPLRHPASLWRFVRRLRAGDYDLALSLVRSPLMSLAIAGSGIPWRAGLDSGGRGFGYNLRAPAVPDEQSHEGEIYLRVVAAVAGREVQAYANLPVDEDARTSVLERLRISGVDAPFIVAHPGGGDNPGANTPSKRYPPEAFANLLNRVAQAKDAAVILIGGPGDAALVESLANSLTKPAHRWVGVLSFREIGALAAGALCYIGNDSGLTHLAAASGARAVMIMGPTNPIRYAPYTANCLALWKPTEPGVAGGRGWEWKRDGIAPDAAARAILSYLNAER